MIIKKFREIVSSHHDKIAIKTKGNHDGALTYGELDRLSDTVAGAIARVFPGGAPGTAALLFGHGTGGVAAVLGALKAHRTYVPLDGTYPDGRLQFMLQDSGARLLLTDHHHLARAQHLQQQATQPIAVLNIDSTDETNEPGEPKEPGEKKSGKNEPAYILYTSGSTGRPRGVMQTRSNMLFFAENYIRSLSIGAADRMTFFSSFSHDGALQDIFGALLSGATLYPLDIRTTAPADIYRLMRDEAITLYHSVPSLFRYFLTTIAPFHDSPDLFPRLRLICMGGEAYRPGDPDLIKTHFPGAQLAHMYGQTESSVNTMVFVDTNGATERPRIGEPFAGIDLLLINREGEEADVLEEGEICLASPYLSPGYWQDPRATAAAFLEDSELGRIYRTGDMGRLDPDGGITFLGRRDHQVKIRGFRVEPGEIESHMLKCPGITAAVVTARETRGDMVLCGYYVCGGAAAEPPAVTEERLRHFLSGHLAPYMVPRCLVRLGALPLTGTGKIDRNALPDPPITAAGDSVAPSGPLEEKLARIWADVLEMGDQLPGRQDDFLSLGGHSLRAVLAAGRIHRELGVKLTLTDMFENPTLGELAVLMESRGARVPGGDYTTVAPAEERDHYPLSPSQRRIYFLHLADPAGTAYNMPLVLPLRSVNGKNLQRALDRLIARHESLRTSFHLNDGVPVQVVHPAAACSCEIRHYPTYAGAKETAAMPFDLTRAPLMRVSLAPPPDDRDNAAGDTDDGNRDDYMLVVDMHHLVADGLSRQILARDFAQFLGGGEPAPPRVRYRDYVLWLGDAVNGDGQQKQESYWLGRFTGQPPVLNLPTDYPRPALQSFAGSVVFFELPPDQTAALGRIAADRGATRFMVLLAVCYAFLSKITGQDDMVIGTPVAGRNHPDLENVIGVLINTLALRCDFGHELPFTQCLGGIKQVAMGAFDHQEYPFESLVEKTGADRDRSRNPLFDIVFTFHPESAPPASSTVSSTDTPDSGETSTTETDRRRAFYVDRPSKFDLGFIGTERDGAVEFMVEYGTALFKRETVERLTGYFRRLVEIVVDQPEIPLSQIEIIPDGEKRQILFDFNDTDTIQDTAQGCPRTIHGFFRRQVVAFGDRTALVGRSAVPGAAGRTVTLGYRELDRRADAMADHLRALGVGRDRMVGLMTERVPEMLIGTMGILKAGGAYLPLDHGYPEERNQYMLKDCSIDILITQQTLADHIPSTFNGRVIYLDSPPEHKPADSPHPDNRNHIDRDAGALILYTSGSTGKPKGVLLHHGGTVNVAHFHREILGVTEADRVALFGSAAYDASLFEWTMAFFFGAALVVLTETEVYDYRKYEDFLNKYIITSLLLPPVYLNNLEADRVNPLRVIVTGGARPAYAMIDRWKDKAQYINAYGPTEITICCTMNKFNDAVERRAVVPIGKPLHNSRIDILDRGGNLCPVGIAGEVFIGGEGVARGYLNRPELTAERFQLHRSYCSYRTYKTGDSARWLEDGNIEFLGRIDFMVKIRGFRIELSEIEHWLSKHDDIREVAVIATCLDRRTDQDDLVAFVVGDFALTPEKTAQFREYLGKYLPNYMVPHYFVQRSGFPLTPSDKVDTAALARTAPDAVAGQLAAGAASRTPARNPLESHLVDIWCRVLDREDIGIDDNFFDIGGHSLKAVQIIAQVRKGLSVEIGLRDILENPTVAALAPVIRRRRRREVPRLRPVEKRDYYPLSGAQKRLWILHQVGGAGSSYNIPAAYLLEGRLDHGALEHTFRDLVARHEILRTSFATVGGEPVQVVHDRVEFSITHEPPPPGVDIDVLPETFPDELRGCLNRHAAMEFDLTRAPLFNVTLFRSPGAPGAPGAGDSKQVLLFNNHHIISDAWSMEILTRELIAHYNARTAGTEPTVTPLGVHYKDYSHWQRELEVSGHSDAQREYWHRQLGDLGRGYHFEFPTDYPRPARRGYLGANYSRELPADIMPGIRELCKQRGVTLFMVLTAALNVFIYRYTGFRDIIIGSPTSGRGHPDLENQMGFYVNTLPMRHIIDDNDGFADFLDRVKETVIGADENQAYPFERMVEEFAGDWGADRGPFFDIVLDLYTPGTDRGPGLRDLKISGLPVKTQAGKFDLTFNFSSVDQRLFLSLDYRTDLFRADTVDRLYQWFENVLTTVVENSEIRLSSIGLLKEGVPAAPTDAEISGEINADFDL